MIQLKSEFNEKPYKCDTCEKVFTQRGTLAYDKRIHKGITAANLDGKKIFNEDSSSHQNSANDCGEGKEVETMKEEMNEEERRIHTGEKPYACNFCEKRFKEKSTLPDHKRIHTGEKPYKCEICAKTFTQRGNLVTYKRIHKDNNAAHFNARKSLNEDSSTHQTTSNDCGEGNKVETIHEEIYEEESVDDPPSIHQDNKNKEEELYDIEEFKIEPGNNINDVESDQNNVNQVNNPILVNNIDEEVVDDIEENVNEGEGNILVDNMDEAIVDNKVDNIEENVNEIEVGQENDDFQGLENLSVAEALAFFSS